VSSKRSFLRDVAGGSAVEFSLLVTCLLPLLLGGFQLGMALHYGESVRWALETSARSLVLTPDLTSDELRTQMLTYLGGVPGANAITVNLATDTTNPQAKVETATSRYSYPLSIPLLPAYNLTFNASVSVPAP
jgi:Flp pilus assembly protein TadG